MLAACGSNTSSQANANAGSAERRRSNASSSRLSIVECARSPRQAPQHPDQSELRHRNVDQQREIRLLGEVHAVLGLTLRLCKRSPAAENSAFKLAQLKDANVTSPLPVRDLEGATKRIAGVPEMLGPCQGRGYRSSDRSEPERGKVRAVLTSSDSILLNQIPA